MRPTWPTFLFVGSLLFCAGCGEKSVPVYPVTGTVTFNDQTLSTGTVTFFPVDQGPAVTGEIKEDGTYRLTMRDGRQGAPAGQYRVAVSAVRITDRGEAIPLIPSKYSTGKTSGLTATVEKDPQGETNVYDVKLTGAP